MIGTIRQIFRVEHLFTIQSSSIIRIIRIAWVINVHLGRKHTAYNILGHFARAPVLDLFGLQGKGLWRL